MPSPFESRPLYSAQEAADATGLPVRLIRSLMREARLRFYWIGDRRLVDLTDLEPLTRTPSQK